MALARTLLPGLDFIINPRLTLLYRTQTSGPRYLEKDQVRDERVAPGHGGKGGGISKHNLA